MANPEESFIRVVMKEAKLDFPTSQSYGLSVFTLTQTLNYKQSR